MSLTCILCGHTSLRRVAGLPAQELAACYMEQFGIDIRPDLGDVQLIKVHACASCELVQFSPAVCGSREFYAHFQRFSWYYMPEKPEFNFAMRYLRPGMHVLDAGCGTGLFATKLADASYTGVETSPEAVEQARSLGRDVRLTSIQQYAAANEGVHDMVCAFQVLEHVSDPCGFARAMAQALAPGGVMIVSVPSLDSFQEWVPNYVLDMPPHHVSRWRDASLAALAPLCGLELAALEHEQLQPYHHELYASALIFHGLWRSMTKKPQPYIDRSELGRQIKDKAREMTPLLIHGLTGPKLAPKGLSVMACLRKPKAA